MKMLIAFFVFLALATGSASAQEVSDNTTMVPDSIWNGTLTEGAANFTNDFCETCRCCKQATQNDVQIAPDFFRSTDDMILLRNDVQALSIIKNSGSIDFGVEPLKGITEGLKTRGLVDFCEECKCCVITSTDIEITKPEAIQSRWLERYHFYEGLR